MCDSKGLKQTEWLDTLADHAKVTEYLSFSFLELHIL